MAKKAAKKASTEKSTAPTTESLVNDIYESINEKYGEGHMVDGDEYISKPQMVIPFGPVFDVLTSGGIQEGSFVGFAGKEKTGKTTSILSFAAQCQKPEYGSRPVFYFKIEGRLSRKHTQEIEGLITSKPLFNIFQSEEGRILSAQDQLNEALNIVKTVPGSVIILDSLSALTDQKEIDGGIGFESRGGGAKLLNQFLRLAKDILPVNRVIVIGVGHMMANVTGRGQKQWLEKGSQYWRHQCDYLFSSTYSKPWTIQSTGKQIGLETQWLCMNTPLGSPGKKMTGYLRFGVGVDRIFELLSLGRMGGLIHGKGWYYLAYLKNHKSEFVDKVKLNDSVPKAQGDEAVYRLLKQNPEYAELLRQDLVNLLGDPECCIGYSKQEE